MMIDSKMLTRFYNFQSSPSLTICSFEYTTFVLSPFIGAQISERSNVGIKPLHQCSSIVVTWLSHLHVTFTTPTYGNRMNLLGLHVSSTYSYLMLKHFSFTPALHVGNFVKISIYNTTKTFQIIYIIFQVF